MSDKLFARVISCPFEWHQSWEAMRTKGGGGCPRCLGAGYVVVQQPSVEVVRLTIEVGDDG